MVSYTFIDSCLFRDIMVCMKKHLEIRVRGIVQGVGFRPFIYRAACEKKLSGHVLNDTEGVIIHAEGESADLSAFMEHMERDAPPLARIESIEVRERKYNGYVGFSIRASEIGARRSAFIPPDSAVCGECLGEFFDPADRRHHYPFITCTNCGPRFSIATDIPYDRKNTSMVPFTMCDRCASEYADPLDRRFHTQPDACAVCGPRLSLRGRDGSLLLEGTAAIATETVNLLKTGHIVAIKGVGGYLIACDARDEEALRELRQRKGRPTKPFAVMAAGPDRAGEFVHISPEESALLLSSERPIVLLKEKKPLLGRLVAPSLTYIGLMLPYTPFQHLLFSLDESLSLVMTSGNVADEPIIFRDDEAFERLGGIADRFVTYNREITGFTDDSVLFVHDRTPYFIRRSRGYVPVPFASSRARGEMLATGGDLKNSFAFARENVVILSQFLGDLASPASNELYRATIDHLTKVYHLNPEVVVSDMHPGYFTTQFADEMEGRGLGRVRAQHHHAHIASVIEDRNIEGNVIGIAYDGTGYGTDGHLWGSEFLIAGRADFTRAAHFSYFPLPGGESAIHDVWKIGVSLLYQRFGDSYPLMERSAQSDMLIEIIQKKVSTPLTCSIGRIFDGLAAILGLSRRVSAEAEAAMLLEEAALGAAGTGRPASHLIPCAGEDVIVVSTDDLVDYIVTLKKSGKATGEIAYLFHCALARTTVHVSEMLRERHGSNTVALSGGSFQNRLLLTLITEGLAEKQFDIYAPRKIPFNDGCIALGQIAIAKERGG